MIRATILLALILFVCTASFSQEVIRQQPCNDTSIARQADSIKLALSKDGYSLLREASVTMESEYEMPVVVPMQERGIYHFAFIGDYSSRMYEVRMYDYDEKMVVYQKKMWGEIDGNIISFNYVPQFTEYHMIKPVQVNKMKRKGLCGYVLLFKKTKP